MSEERTLAQFWFEIGFAACWAEAYVQNDSAPFELNDRKIAREFEKSIEAHDDPAEIDAFKALADAAPELLEALEALEACRAQFDFYAAEHRKAEKHEKAATNERFAFLCSKAINLAKEGR